jgi:hypothetical protein
MADVLSDSFEQPLSNRKTPSSEVAINKLTSATFLCLSLDFFGLGCCVSGARDVFPTGCVAGFLSGLPDNPSCVKCAILASCTGFPPVGNSRSKIAAVAKWTDSVRVRGESIQKDRGPWETLWRLGHEWSIARRERVRTGWHGLAKGWHPCSSGLNLFQTALTVDYSRYCDNSPVDAVVVR